jgi:hypothetical protein
MTHDGSVLLRLIDGESPTCYNPRIHSIGFDWLQCADILRRVANISQAASHRLRDSYLSTVLVRI